VESPLSPEYSRVAETSQVSATRLFYFEESLIEHCFFLQMKIITAR
jgi:hypothetical protein